MQLAIDDKPTHPILRARQQVSGYQLIKRIGRGGVAEVWEAESPAGYRVALKLVHLSTDVRSGELRALEITRGIRHRSLLMILGTWQVENLLVIAMELADRSLWDRFLETNSEGLRGIPRTELLGYLDSVADAIDHLNDYRHSIAGRHGLGIQHRDLKPQNILLVGKRAKVADFGLARVMEDAVASHTGPCTLPYAAPEYFGGKTSRHSDQYALAVTYCQLRGGQMPFLGTTAQITFGHLCNAPNLEGLPAPERPMVAKALAKRPEERWADCRAFIAALNAIGADQECPIPEALPRQEGGPDSESEEENGLAAPSSSALVSADSDFTPIDTGQVGSALALFAARLRSAALRAGRVGSNAVDRCGPLLKSVHGTNPRGAWLALLGSQRTHVGQGVTRAAQRLSSLSTQRARILMDRVRLMVPTHEDVTRARASLEPVVRTQWARARRGAELVSRGLRRGSWRPARSERNWQGAALAALGLAVLTAGNWFVTHQSRSATAPSTTTAPPAANASPTVGSEQTAPKALATVAELVRSTPSTTLVSGASETNSAGKPPEIDPPGLPSIDEETTTGGQVVATPGAEETVARTAKPEEASVALAFAAGPEKPASETLADSAKTTLSVPELSGPERPNSTTAPPEAPFEAVPKTTSVAALLAVPESKKPAPDGEPPRIDVPAAVTREAGESTKPRVGVRRSDTAQPFQLEFQRLPGGITVRSPAIPAGADRADVSVSASAGTPPGTAEISVGSEAGPERGEAVTRVNVVPRAQATTAYERGQSDLIRGAYAEAVAAFTEAIWLGANWFEAHLYRGVAYNLEGCLQQALADYDEAIRIQPENADAYLVRAKAHCDLGEHRLGLQDYSAAIRLRSDAKTYLARGRLHHEMGAYDQALADFETALRLRANDPAAHYHRGLTRYFMGDHTRAVEDFTEALRLDPQHAAAYRFRGDAFARLGDHARAGADHEAFERLGQPGGVQVLK